jgi:hypothetical protein
MAGAASLTTDIEDHNGQTIQTVLLRPRENLPRAPGCLQNLGTRTARVGQGR